MRARASVCEVHQAGVHSVLLPHLHDIPSVHPVPAAAPRPEHHLPGALQRLLLGEVLFFKKEKTTRTLSVCKSRQVWWDRGAAYFASARRAMIANRLALCATLEAQPGWKHSQVGSSLPDALHCTHIRPPLVCWSQWTQVGRIYTDIWRDRER